MEGPKNREHFTAVDIEKYHKGQLTPAEMHALEKAALDDPFLAEAIESYAQLTHPVQPDLEELRTRLQEKIDSKGSAPLVPIPGREKSGSASWWRAAAAAVILGVLGWGIYQWGFSEGQTPIAKKTEENNSDIRKFENLRDSGNARSNSEIQNSENSGNLENLRDSGSNVREKTSSKEKNITGKGNKTVVNDNNEISEQPAPPVSGAPVAAEQFEAQNELRAADAKRMEENKSIAARAMKRKTSATELPASSADKDSVAPLSL